MVPGVMFLLSLVGVLYPLAVFCLLLKGTLRSSAVYHFDICALKDMPWEILKCLFLVFYHPNQHIQPTAKS